MKHNSQYFVNCLAWAKKSSIVVLPKISKQTAGKPTHNPISAQGMTCSAKSMQLLIWLWLLCYTRKWQKKILSELWHHHICTICLLSLSLLSLYLLQKHKFFIPYIDRILWIVQATNFLHVNLRT